MKRITLLIVVLAALGGGFYWTHTKYNGNVAAAWSDVRSSASALLGRTEPAGGAAGASARGGAPEGQAQRGGGRGGAGGGDAPRMPVIAATAESSNFPITRSSVGWVEPIQTVTVRARIDGQIIEQRAKDGQIVKPGDVLFRIDDREIQAQIARNEAALARDQATLARTQSDLKRAQELLTRENTTPQRVEQTTADYKVALANVAAGQATLEADRIKLSYTTITAPIAGRLGVVRVTPGNIVRAGETTGEGLVTITQLKPLRVSFALPERDLPLLRAALTRKDPAPVRVYSSGSTEVLATGTLAFVDSAVDITSGTITAKGLFANDDDQLWPGQYVRVEVDLGVQPNVTSIPLVAVQPGQDGSFVYAIRANNTVERRRVEVSETRGDRAAVTSGVKPGDRVVVEGQQRLRDGTAIAEKEQTPRAAAVDRTARTE
jgi:multidrug efflux system membrane fusion protein